MEIHPVIARDNCTIGETVKIPVCSELLYNEGKYETIPEKCGSLKDLHALLTQLFETEKRNTDGLMEFKLAKDVAPYLNRSLDEILEQVDFLDKYKKTVICCPLHYLSSNSYKKEENELVKLIHQIDRTKLQNHQDLKEFYDKNVDSWIRKKKRINFYTSINSAALLWFDHIKRFRLHDTPGKTQNTLLNSGTFQ